MQYARCSLVISLPIAIARVGTFLEWINYRLFRQFSFASFLHPFAPGVVSFRLSLFPREKEERERKRDELVNFLPNGKHCLLAIPRKHWLLQNSSLRFLVRGFLHFQFERFALCTVYRWNFFSASFLRSFDPFPLLFSIITRIWRVDWPPTDRWFIIPVGQKAAVDWLSSNEVLRRTEEIPDNERESP